MSNIGYREIMDTSPLSIKQLNDTLRALWSKVMGGIEERDLNGQLMTRLEGALDRQTFETVIAQTEQQILLRASQTELDLLGQTVAQNQADLSVQADQIAARVSKNDFEEFAETVLTKDSFEVNIDGENQLHVGADGVSAVSITAPNVAAVYDGPGVIQVLPTATDEQVESSGGGIVRSLQQAISRLNDKRLRDGVSVIMNRLSHYEDIEIHGVTGSGALEIIANSATVYGSVSVKQCTAQVNILGGMTIYSGSKDALSVEACTFVRADGLVGSGSGENGVCALGGSRVFLWGGDFNGYVNALNAGVGSTLCAASCKGDGKVTATLGGVCALSDTMPCGGINIQMNGQVWADGVGSTPGSGEPAPSEVVSASFAAVNTATCRNSGSWMDSSGVRYNLRQNYTEGYGVCKGCIWFDNAALRSALAGKNILSASLRLTRVTGSGRSHAVQVILRGLTLSENSGSLPNDPSSAVYGGLNAVLGEIGNDETVTFSVPPDFIRALAAEEIEGLCLYGGETTEYNDRGYSRNYCRFYGLGEQEGCDPVLTITCQ